jgi:hypothetical protein
MRFAYVSPLGGDYVGNPHHTFLLWLPEEPQATQTALSLALFSEVKGCILSNTLELLSYECIPNLYTLLSRSWDSSVSIVSDYIL